MKPKSPEDQVGGDHVVPLPIQTFLWRQTSSFVRPKLGKLHEASCIFCQQAPGHHEMKEACKSLEKVLVQNIQFGLSPSLTEAIRSIPRWKFVQCALPHVMLCAAQLISERKDTNNLHNVGTAASKLLYTLHWTLLDAAEECADADRETGVVPKEPFPYIFHLTCIQEFVYLFAPLRHLLKEADLQNFRLENGLKIWPALWDYRHPNAPCFTTPVRPKKNQLLRTNVKNGTNGFPSANPGPTSTAAALGNPNTKDSMSDVFIGATAPAKLGICDSSFELNLGDSNSTLSDQEHVRRLSKDEFPETIPEETSSAEEEHVVIFRLAPAPEDQDAIRASPVYRAESSIIQPRTYLTADYNREGGSHPRLGECKRLLSISQERWMDNDPIDPQFPHRRSSALEDVTIATFLDVAVVRCLFMPRWSEEGVHWALQFLFYRLQEISEEMRSRCPQRKRSSSLPVPKIEVSLCSEVKTKDSPKGETPQIDDAASENSSSLEAPSPSPAPSETRTKEESGPTPNSNKRRPYKMADLKAFVESRLLSRSEKTLEKVGMKYCGSRPSIPMDDKISSGKNELETDSLIPPRPLSALAHTTDTEACKSYLDPPPLLKGKSMPSLRYLGLTEGKSQKKLDSKSASKLPVPAGASAPAAPIPVQLSVHPVITVTEPMSGSHNGSQVFTPSALIHPPGKSHPSPGQLNRSQTDSNIQYPYEELAEAAGSTHFVNKDGTLNFYVILLAIHAITARIDVCSVRVCETSLSVLEILLDLGVVSLTEEDGVGTGETNYKSSDPTTGSIPETLSCKTHSICFDIVAKVFQHVGCPHGCGDSRRDPSSDFIRSQGLLLLARLHRISGKFFRSHLRQIVSTRYSLAEVVDFLHALVGFCVDSGFILSPMSQKRNSRFGTEPSQQGLGFIPAFNAPRTTEGHVISCIFKPFVTRLTTSLKFLKSSENVALYCDVRQLLSYIKDVHGATFRRVLLSGLLDATTRPQQNADDSPPGNGGRFYKENIHVSNELSGGPSSAAFFVVDETMSERNRKSNNRKGTGSELDAWSEESRKNSVAQALVMSGHRFREKDRSKGRFSFTANRSEKKSSRLALAVNWIRKERRFPSGSPSHEESSDHQLNLSTNPAMIKFAARGNNNNVGVTLQKARRRMEHHLTRIGLGRSRKQVISHEITPDPSRRNSMEMDNGREMYLVTPRERKMVSTPSIYDGMLRLNFLLEACQPGTVPDASMIAAVLDLPQAPVVARAAFLFECAHFVHRCNRGQWPSWMKLNLPFFRPSGPLSNRGTPSGQRRTHILQRLGGRMFFSWAEAIGLRLEEILIEELMCNDDFNAQQLDEHRQRLLLDEDENEDFLVEASVNPSGQDFPWALRLAACMLLFEITAFLRDSYRRLPRSTRVSVRSSNDKPLGNAGSLNVGSINERSQPTNSAAAAESAHPSGPVLAAGPSNHGDRRWSMALSFMGQSQASAQSLQSITGDVHSMSGTQTGERKISFVLHEPDDESMDSSNTTLTFQGDDEEKKNRRLAQGRPYLLRRSTTGNAAGSFKRRSLKLRRSHRERRDPDSDSMKRSDSIRSKRKVSSISSRSDISDVHLELDVSGEESPGILSDDQPPESPTDILEIDECISTRGFPWIKAVLLLANSFDYQCNHQNFCHPRCFQRQMRACSRMLNSVRKVYGDEPQLEAMEFMNFTKKSRCGHGGKDEVKKDKSNKIASRPGSPLRRRDSTFKRDRIDRSADSMPKTGSYPSSSALSRDHIDHDSWDKSKLEGVSGFHGKSSPNDGEEEPKIKKKEEHQLIKYLKYQVMDLFQAPLLVLVKSATILHDEAFLDIIPIAWELLLDFHKETVAAAAAIFILSAVRCPEQISILLNSSLKHPDPVERIKALHKFQVLWRSRYQVWPRMEEGAAHTFKVPPHSIEFTLPSPKIGVESLPVVDPPWMPYIRTGFQEVTLNQETHRSLVTATKSRKKQQTEQMEAALKAEEDRKCTERENFLVTTVPVTIQASYEPALHHVVGDDHDDIDDETEQQQRSATQPLQMAQVLFPSCLCAAIVPILSLLDDSMLTSDGIAVHDVAYQVVNSCLVEDTPLFLRYVLERLTREKQDEMFAVMRRLLRFFPQLPQQTAFNLHNYLIGFIMFYVRTPSEGSQELVGNALSLLSIVAPNVQGLLFKDLKQILRKEQCDAAILITANVPSAKKIVVHGPGGPDAGGIPSQFPIQEDTQFCQILQEALDFFGIEESRHREYFLVDHRTNQIHNPSTYVRDYYFFKRSQYPQLSLVHMEPARAHDALQIQAFTEKMVELGKVLFVSSILKNPNQLVARVLFLHEELMKLPSFPRKALEVDLHLNSNGCMGKELCALDFLHKLSWVKLVSRMFEAMVGNFAYSGDIHLFINVVNGALVVHCEDVTMLRYCMATYINAAHHFRNVFALNGYSLIIPTILRIYSNYQNNLLVTRTIEFTIQQFYIMHRKPFMFQLFGTVAPLLDTDESSVFGDTQKIRVQSLFRLLLSLEHVAVDPIHILDLVSAEKPLKALDFCYHGENDTINVLDSISLAVMGASYAIDTTRGHQLLTILEAVLPAYLRHLQSSSGRKDPRTERDILHQIGVAVKTLINNAEALTKHYTGPQRTFEKTPSQKRSSNNKAPLSATIEIDEDSHSRFLGDHFSHRKTSVHERDIENDSEVKWQEFRSPRTTLLSLVSDYFTVCCARLTELNKKQGQDSKSNETLDIKCHLRLADIAHTLLKVASYDANTMACRGLQVYMTVLMPNAEWSLEPLRPALTMLFRRLDKIFLKIEKISTMRKNLKWDACAGLLHGVFLTLRKCPYIVHVQHLRSLVNTCQSLILADLSSSTYNVDGSPVRGGGSSRRPYAPPPAFCSMVVQLIAMQILALGETYSLEQACGGSFIFPTPERTESVLLHLILPLCLRVGSGRKDAPRIRQSDISFALTVIFQALNPPQPRPQSTSSKNVTSNAEPRSGSLSVQGSTDAKIRTRSTLSQVAFLGLKILMTCFSQQLTLDWPRVARCVRDIGERRDGGGAFWNFLIFVATQRGPLFAHILPLMWRKVSTPVDSEEEQILQDLLRQKLNGSSEISPLPTGELMECFQTELSILNDEFIHYKEDEPEADNRRSIVPEARSELSNISAFSRRPTCDSNASRRDPILHHGPARVSSIPNASLGLSSAQLRRQWSVRSESHHVMLQLPGRLNSQVPTTNLIPEGYKTVDKMMRRTSYAGEVLARGGLPPAACSAASDTRLHRRSLGPSTSSISQSSISETEFYELDEAPFAEGLSPTMDTSPATCETGRVSETTHIHPRLHRQKLQSKGKTFRFKKQAMANIQVSHIEVEQELVTLPPVRATADSHPFQLLLVPTASRLGTVRREYLTAESRLVSNTPSSSDSPAVTTSLTSAKPVISESVHEQRLNKSASPSGAVTVGVAVQVSASSYVPAGKGHRGAQYKSARTSGEGGYQLPVNPPPVPPRSVRLSVNYPSSTDTSGSNPPSPYKKKAAGGTGGGSADDHYKSMPTVMSGHMGRGRRAESGGYREPPLLEENDTIDRVGDLSNSSSSVNATSDSELDNSRSGTLSCVRSSQDGDTSNESLTLGEDSTALITRVPTVRSQHPNVERDENTLI